MVIRASIHTAGYHVKTLTTGIVAVLAVMTAPSAQGGAGVMEFEGFIITYEGSGRWSSANREYDRSGLFANGTVDASHGAVRTTDEGGVRYSEGAATFGAASPFELQSFAGGGTDSRQAAFSYTIQAKPGWQLSTAHAWQKQGGRYLDFAGGTTSVSGAGAAWTTGGALPFVDNRVAKSPTSRTDASTTGTWSADYVETAFGNGVTSSSRPLHDADGKLTGYAITYVLAEDYVDPLTALAGSFAEQLSASTADCAQLGIVTGDASAFHIGATAVRDVSLVPELPVSTMMAASLGLIAMAARRHAGKACRMTG